MTAYIGRRVLVPFLREVPIWRFGPIYGISGEYVRDGWYQSRFGKWEVTDPSKSGPSGHAELERAQPSPNPNQRGPA